jgi:N4-gp56 family major capsid protein
MAHKLNTLIRGPDVDAFSPLTDQQQIYYSAMLIKRLLPYLPMFADGQKVTIPTRSGGFSTDSINFRRFLAMPVDTTPLVEGVPPDPKQIQTATVKATLAQYGDWVKLTDILLETSIDDMMMQAMDLLAENAGQKLHKIILNALVAGVTQQIFGGSATSAVQLDATMVITSTVIKKAVRMLRSQNVPTFPDGMYRGVLHPYQVYDLQGDSLWQDVAKYDGGIAQSGGPNILAGEIGRIHGVKFLDSTEMPTDTAGASSANTYTGFIYGPDAYGLIDLKSQAVKNINANTLQGIEIKAVPRGASKEDPLDQWSAVGWKASFVAKVLDPTRMVRIRTGATQ